MKERSPYQQKIIKNYYKNRSALSHQRLSELVTDLYLAEGKKRGDNLEKNPYCAREPRSQTRANRALGTKRQP